MNSEKKDDVTKNAFTMLKLAQGNPGALMFLMELMGVPPELGFGIMLKIEQCPTLKGANLYVLWSDLCNKDLERVSKLCKNCPNDILEDACSRQDYSGR